MKIVNLFYNMFISDFYCKFYFRDFSMELYYYLGCNGIICLGGKIMFRECEN